MLTLDHLGVDLKVIYFLDQPVQFKGLVAVYLHVLKKRWSKAQIEINSLTIVTLDPIQKVKINSLPAFIIIQQLPNQFSQVVVLLSSPIFVLIDAHLSYLGRHRTHFCLKPSLSMKILSINNFNMKLHSKLLSDLFIWGSF